MIYKVRHTTRYSYATPMDLAAHMIHLRPRALPWQRVLAAGLTVTPKAARLPSITMFTDFVTAGGYLAYGPVRTAATWAAAPGAKWTR